MRTRERPTIRFHEDPDLFREAVGFTAAETGFTPQLVEKDYFCSLLLNYLAVTEGSLIFKGGTCLTKVHAGFYRLSEDIDFSISAPVGATRAERRALVAGVKGNVATLHAELSYFDVIGPLRGANDSAQYLGVVAYSSLVSGQPESIRIEIGLREPLLLPTTNGPAKTVLLDPVSREPAVAPIEVRCISKSEAFAEKFRAALSRREPAVRDFFDIDYAVRKIGLLPHDEGLVSLIRTKLDVPGNDPVNISKARLVELQRQLAPQLKPVLRERDFREFDLERSFTVVTELAERLG